MINSKDTKVIKELVVSAIGKAYLQCTGNFDFKGKKEAEVITERAFDIVINEMKQGRI